MVSPGAALMAGVKRNQRVTTGVPPLGGVALFCAGSWPAAGGAAGAMGACGAPPPGAAALESVVFGAPFGAGVPGSSWPR